jgi:hypothetical protein
MNDGLWSVAIKLQVGNDRKDYKEENKTTRNKNKKTRNCRRQEL